MHRYVYISVFFAALLGYEGVEAACANYKCFNGDLKAVEIGGVNVSCAEGTYCNKYELGNCSPCVEDLCFFKCPKDRSKFVVEGVEYNCPKDTYCNPNWDKNSKCNPCMETECSEVKNFFTCNPNNETVAIVHGILMLCFPGYTCNRYYDEPCQVCIKTSGASQQPTTTTTTTTLATTTTTRAPSFDAPNCNDGNAVCFPCRPGAPGSQVYYKCQRSILNGYVADTRSCSYLMYDTTCRRYNFLCR